MTIPDSLQRRITRAWATLRHEPTLLTNARHPNPDLARQGRSFRSYVVYLLRSGGNAGKTRGCKYVEEAMRRRSEPRLPILREQSACK